MGRQSADDFLTCVMKRSENDLIIRVGALILLFVVVPILAIIIAADINWFYNEYIRNPSETVEFPKFIVDHIDDFAGAHLMEYTIGTFILFIIIRSLKNHARRDIEWMSALTDYAESYGHDVSALRVIMGRVNLEKTLKLAWGFYIWFLAVLICCICQALFISLDNLEVHTAVMTINVLIFEMVIQVCFTSFYIQWKIRKLDRIQCDFTKVFCWMMKGDFVILMPMPPSMKPHKLKRHLVAIALTLGSYSTFYLLWSVEVMNKHIRRQWTYEEYLLGKIIKQEGATGAEGYREDIDMLHRIARVLHKDG